MVDAFLLKKLVSVFTQIIPGTLILLLLALVLQRWWPRAGRGIAIFICCLLILGSMAPVSNLFVARLELQFPVLSEAPADTAMILVLGNSHMFKEDRPVNSVLSSTALSRLTEGVRLWKTRPEAYLALSGANSRSEISHAGAMQRMAVQLGVPAWKILLFEQTRDTEEEILAALEKLDALIPSEAYRTPEEAEIARLVVTSSATHLPRAAMLLEDKGAVYAMAPTDYVMVDAPWYRPNSNFLRNIDRVLHEWVGMAWYRLRNTGLASFF